MASKIEDKSLYVGITPYKHEGQTYDVINVTAGYRKGRGFYVSVHPGWKSDFGFGCMFDFSQNPLSDTTWVNVMEAPKNSQKTIDTMHANLCGKTAQKIIRLLFDGRKWEVLKMSLKHIAKDSAWATEALLASLSKGENTDNQNSSTNNKEDKTMKLNLSNQKNESGNVQNNAQVNNSNEPIVRQVDVMGLMGALNRDGHAKLSDHVIEDAEAVEVKDEQAEEIESVNVGEVTLSSIMPKMTAEPEAPTKPAESNTGRTKIVVARVPHPGESGDGPKPTTPTKPTKTTLTEVRLVVYTTARTQQQAPRIEGFAGEDDPRWKKHYDEKQRLKGLKADAEKKNDRLRKQMKGKTKAEKEAMMAQWVVVPNDPFNASYFTDRTTGEKTYSLVMGAKYLDVAQQLVDAYNTDDLEAWARAEQAVAEVKSSVVAEAVAERQAKREERQAKREAEKAASERGQSDACIDSAEREQARPEVKAATEQPTPETKAVQGYTDKDVADMLKRIMAGEAIPENIKLAMAA